MRITILTYGSRGDVQPFLPLSRRLMEEGHSVKLAAPSRFNKFVEEHGIGFVPLPGDPEDLSRRLNNAGRNFVKLLRELTEHAVEIGADVWRQTEEACQDADLILHTFTHAVGAHTLAREKNIPDVHIQTFPMFTPTGDYPNVTLPDLRSHTLNRLTHNLSAQITWWTSRIGFERVRRREGFAHRKLYWPFDHDSLHPRTPILCAWSPRVLPPSSDWPPNVHVTGYYFFADHGSYQPHQELESFLRWGKPPVCVSFGSMVNRDAKKNDGIVRTALEQTGNRGIILSGWSGVKSSSSNDLLYLDAAPHDWLLPRCKLVVHHGGAGTTAAGLRAGIPNIVVPFMADQPFWGRRVHAIGVGPQPLRVKSLSVKGLVRAIAEAEDQSLRTRAQSIGQQIRNEDGVGIAVELIEKYFNNFQRKY
ncbi:MAG TPA: glycosyltransferase [Anaerolineales bacterium]|nr:glycosyltransferase [Anaerolineales bacterium]